VIAIAIRPASVHESQPRPDAPARPPYRWSLVAVNP